MKSRNPFLIAISLLILILSIAFFIFSTRNQATLEVFKATVNRDCAPWDGAAFTVSIPYDSTSIVTISIWQSPKIRLPVRFSFPDDTGRAGNVAYLSPSDEYEQLIGGVSFSRVEAGVPVKGEFSLRTESGKQFKGKFEAQWGDEIVYCG